VLGKADVPVCSLARRLSTRGHEVHLVTALFEEDPPENVTVHPIALSGARILSAGAGVARVIQRLRPELLHAFYLTSYGYLASFVRGLPVLATAMGTDVFGAPELSPFLAPVRRAMARRAIRRADRIHSVAAHMTRRLVELGADPARIDTFARGISLERFPPARRSVPPSPPWRLLCNRRLEPIYDHAVLIRAAKRLQQAGVPFELRIVGRGSLRSKLARLVGELGLDEVVRIESPVAHEGVPALLAGSDVLVTASRSDGTSSCLLEAMAAGCIPVVSGIEANRPWISDSDNGFVFAAGDDEALARAIRRAIESASRWESIRLANRRRVEMDGSFERGCDRIEGIYSRMTERREKYGH